MPKATHKSSKDHKIKTIYGIKRLSDDISKSRPKKVVPVDPMEAAFKLKEKLKIDLDIAESKDQEIKNLKISKKSKNDINLYDTFQITKQIDQINSNKFIQASFLSSKNTSVILEQESSSTLKHDSAIFGKYSKSLQISKEIDLSTIELPKYHPKSIIDPKMLVNEKFHVSREEKMKDWNRYLQEIACKI